MIIIYNGKRYEVKGYGQVMPGDFYMAGDVGGQVAIKKQPLSSPRSGNPTSLILEEVGDSHKEAAIQIRHWKDEAWNGRQHSLSLARTVGSLYDTLITLHHALIEYEYAYIDGNTAKESIPHDMLKPMFDELRDILQEPIDTQLARYLDKKRLAKKRDCENKG